MEGINVKEPKVSVIIPVYNTEKYLSQCMESILNQTLHEIEVICIDDGSTDGSLSILEAFREKDSRVIVLKQNNLYAGTARNNGMKIAKGKYLSFLDSDDYFEPDMLDIAYKVAEERNTDILIYQAEFFDDDTKEILPSHWLVREEYLPPMEVFTANDIKNHIFDISLNVAWNKFIKREFIERNSIEFQSTVHTNDTYFICMAMIKASRISYINNRLVHYRRNVRTSLSSTSIRQDNPLVIKDVLIKIQTELQKMNKYEEMKQSFSNFALDQLLFNLRSVEGLAYSELYRNIRDSWLEKFDILNHDEDYYYYADKFKLLKKIVNGEIVTPYLTSNYDFDGLKRIINTDMKVVICGAGKAGSLLYNKATIEYGWNVVLWVDKNYEALQKKGFHVSSLRDIYKITYDKVIIAVMNKDVAMNIYQELQHHKIDKQAIVWMNS